MSENLLELTVSEIYNMLPKRHYVNLKRLWCGDLHVDIDHIDNDLDKPLNYKIAGIKMLKKLNQQESGR